MPKAEVINTTLEFINNQSLEASVDSNVTALARAQLASQVPAIQASAFITADRFFLGQGPFPRAPFPWAQAPVPRPGPLFLGLGPLSLLLKSISMWLRNYINIF